MDEIEPAYLPWQTELLETALRLKRDGHLAHAILLDTTQESSIAGFALHLAGLLLCDAPRGVDWCNACDACRLLRAGTYPDLSLVTQAVRVVAIRGDADHDTVGFSQDGEWFFTHSTDADELVAAKAPMSAPSFNR